MADEFVGLDTNVLIDFIQHPLTQQFVFGLRIVQDKELCTSQVCIDESKNVLIKYKSENPESEITNLLTKCKIAVLKVTDNDKTLAKQLFFKYKLEGAHLSDMLILANFINNDINIIIGADYSFQKIIEKEGLQSIKIPNKDKIHEIMFKRSIRF